MKNKNVLLLLIVSITLLLCLTATSAKSNNSNVDTDLETNIEQINDESNTNENNIESIDNKEENIDSEIINKKKIKEKTNTIIKKDTSAIAVNSSYQLGTSGNYYLTNNIYLNKFELRGSFILDGKGHTITLGDEFKAEHFNGPIHIKNTIFTGNEKMELECGDVLIENCTFKSFSSEALEVSDDAKDPQRTSDEKVVIRNCSFENNNEESLKIKECEATVDNCNFINCYVHDGVILAKRATLIVTNTNITSCQAPAFYLEKGGSIYINNVFIDGVNQTKKENTSNQYYIKNKDNQTGQIILPSIESTSNINITANNTLVNKENNIQILLYDESSNPITNALIKITIIDTNNNSIEIQKTTDTNGIVSINQTSQFAGVVKITSIYDGQSGSYTSSNNSSNYTVSKETSKETLAINIESVNTSIVNTPLNITVYLTNVNSTKINPENTIIKIKSNTVTSTIVNNTLHVEYTPTEIGDLNISVEFGGNAIYEETNSSKIIKITSNDIIKKKTNIIMIDDMDGEANGFFKAYTPELLPVKFNVTDEDNNEVCEGIINIVESYQVIGSIDLSSGARIFNYDTLSHPFGASIAKRLKINYIGTENYEDSNNTFIISIIRAKTTQRTNLTVTASNTTVKNNNTITVSLKANAESPIEGEVVTVTIDGVSQNYTTDEEGQIIITNYTSSVERNNVTVVVNYGGSYSKDLFAAFEQSTTFDVLKNPDIKKTIISIVDTRDDAVDNIIRGETNQSIVLEAKVTDLSGNPVEEGIVTFTFSKNVLATINLSETNIAYYNPLEINIAAVSARKIKLEYLGTADYDYSNTTFTLSIKKSSNTPLTKISVNATNTTVGKNNTITAALTGDGNPLSNEKIILNIDGTDYKFITDNEGKVTYTGFSLNEAKVVKVIAIYTGNYELKYMAAKNNTTTFYVNSTTPENKSTIIQLIDTHDDEDNGKIRITNKEIGLIEFKVIDNENNEVNKGIMTLTDMSNNILGTINLTSGNRTFTVNSLAINFSASKAGYFKLNYTGIDEYQDSNTKFITSLIRNEYINTLLTVNATNTTVNQRNIITVKLTSEDGRAIYGEKVALKITDKTYYVTTNAEGIGQYKIFSYPMEKIIEVNAQYPGNTTRYYGESNDTTSFTVGKATNISDEKSTSTLYLDKHDGIDDYLLDIYTDRLNKIEYIVVDVNGNEIKEGTATLYVNGLNKANSINMSTQNRTFIFNPLKYNYTEDMQTAFTVYYTGVNGYENSLATIKTTVHKIDNIKTKIDLTATNTTINTSNEIKISLKANDIPLDNKSIEVSIDNKNYTYTTDDNGQLIIQEIQKIAKENIPVLVQYSGDNELGLKPSQNQTTYTVINPKHETSIEYKIIESTPNNATINITIKNDQNTTLKNQNITITLPNGTKINANTKNNTTLTLPTGKNTINIQYKGDNNNLNTTKNITITIPKHNTTINLKSNNKYYVGLNNITGYLTDDNKKAVRYADIIITYDDEIITAKTDKDGKFTFNAKLKEGQNNITATYKGNNTYLNSTHTLNANAVKLNVKLVADNINAIVGDNITLKIRLIDENNNPVENGKLVFKCNGLTLKEDGVFGSNAASKIVSVTDGKVDVSIVANTQLRRAKVISIKYAGSNKYNVNDQTNISVNIERRNASIEVKTQKITNQDTNLLINAYVYDITNNTKTAVKEFEDNFVIFKVNGITIKNAKGEAIKAKIVNGVAQINYTVPIGLAGIYTNLTDRQYTILAIFGSLEYNTNVRNTTTFKVNRSEVFFNDINVTYNQTSKKVKVKAKLQDYHNNMLKGQNTIIVKINGISYKENNKTKVFAVLNGSVDVTLNTDYVKNINSIMLVTGQRVGYLGGRQTTTNITRV